MDVLKTLWCDPTVSCIGGTCCERSRWRMSALGSGRRGALAPTFSWRSCFSLLIPGKACFFSAFFVFWITSLLRVKNLLCLFSQDFVSKFFSFEVLVFFVTSLACYEVFCYDYYFYVFVKLFTKIWRDLVDFREQFSFQGLYLQVGYCGVKGDESPAEGPILHSPQNRAGLCASQPRQGNFYFYFFFGAAELSLR